MSTFSDTEKKYLDSIIEDTNAEVAYVNGIIEYTEKLKPAGLNELKQIGADFEVKAQAVIANTECLQRNAKSIKPADLAKATNELKNTYNQFESQIDSIQKSISSNQSIGVAQEAWMNKIYEYREFMTPRIKRIEARGNIIYQNHKNTATEKGNPDSTTPTSQPTGEPKASNNNAMGEGENLDPRYLSPSYTEIYNRGIKKQKSNGNGNNNNNGSNGGSKNSGNGSGGYADDISTKSTGSNSKDSVSIADLILRIRKGITVEENFGSEDEKKLKKFEQEIIQLESKLDNVCAEIQEAKASLKSAKQGYDENISISKEINKKMKSKMQKQINNLESLEEAIRKFKHNIDKIKTLYKK